MSILRHIYILPMIIKLITLRQSVGCCLRNNSRNYIRHRQIWLKKNVQCYICSDTVSQKLIVITGSEVAVKLMLTLRNSNICVKRSMLKGNV